MTYPHILSYPELQQPHLTISLDLDRNLIKHGCSTREVASELNLPHTRVWKTLLRNKSWGPGWP